MGTCACFVTAIPLQPIRVVHSPNGDAVAKPSTAGYKRVWTTANLNINKTVDSNREDDIASKIASLRKQKRLKSQRQTDSTAVDQKHEDDKNKELNVSADPKISDNSQAVSQLLDVPRISESDLEAEPSLFSQLPDWKKEEVLQSQMREAESFFSRGTSSTTFETPEPTSTQTTSTPPSSDRGDDPKYKPKVSTWGVFPRPDNISRTYGGGRGIPSGATDASLKSEEQQKRDRAVAERLAKYRASRGVDEERERLHEAEILQALEVAERSMGRGEAVAAARELEGVKQWVSNPEGSRLGGRVWLALALAYEANGRRDQAKDIYSQLRRNPFDEIASKAKQLQQGFADMQSLRVDQPANSLPKVIDFTLPDLNFASEKRYETVVVPTSRSKSASGGNDDSGEGQSSSQDDQKLGLGVNIALAALVASPAVLLALLIALKH